MSAGPSKRAPVAVNEHRTRRPLKPMQVGYTLDRGPRKGTVVKAWAHASTKMPDGHLGLEIQIEARDAPDGDVWRHGVRPGAAGEPGTWHWAEE